MQEKKIFIIHSLFFFSMLIYFSFFHIFIIYFTFLLTYFKPFPSTYSYL